MPKALALLPDELKPVVRHQAGQRTIDMANEAYEGSGLDYEVIPFIEDMAAAYEWADLVVCRAGALTIAEIAAAGLPAVYVPFPAAVDDHQTVNARAMEAAMEKVFKLFGGKTREEITAAVSDRDETLVGSLRFNLKFRQNI